MIVVTCQLRCQMQYCFYNLQGKHLFDQKKKMNALSSKFPKRQLTTSMLKAYVLPRRPDNMNFSLDLYVFEKLHDYLCILVSWHNFSRYDDLINKIALIKYWHTQFLQLQMPRSDATNLQSSFDPCDLKGLSYLTMHTYIYIFFCTF